MGERRFDEVEEEIVAFEKKIVEWSKNGLVL